MRELSRGGGEIWLNNDDAASAGIADNDWLECFNANGVFMGRAVVSHRIPHGKTYIHHAQERTVNVPLSPLSGTRGGTHNSLTRPLVKPTQMIGGYGASFPISSTTTVRRAASATSSSSCGRCQGDVRF